MPLVTTFHITKRPMHAPHPRLLPSVRTTFSPQAIFPGVAPRKMACGLKVVRTDGSSLGWGACIGRFVMWNVVTSGIPYLNFILILISGIMAGTDGEKRALHDRVCDTRVVYKQSMA